MANMSWTVDFPGSNKGKIQNQLIMKYVQQNRKSGMKGSPKDGIRTLRFNFHTKRFQVVENKISNRNEKHEVILSIRRTYLTILKRQMLLGKFEK